MTTPAPAWSPRPRSPTPAISAAGCAAPPRDIAGAGRKARSRSWSCGAKAPEPPLSWPAWPSRTGSSCARAVASTPCRGNTRPPCEPPNAARYWQPCTWETWTRPGSTCRAPWPRTSRRSPPHTADAPSWYALRSPKTRSPATACPPPRPKRPTAVPSPPPEPPNWSTPARHPRRPRPGRHRRTLANRRSPSRPDRHNTADPAPPQASPHHHPSRAGALTQLPPQRHTHALLSPFRQGGCIERAARSNADRAS